MTKKIVAFTGSREITNEFLVVSILLKHYPTPKDIIVRVGDAKGVDAIVRDWADQEGLEIEIFEADWKKYGRSAGPIRNAAMMIGANEYCAIWDGVSRGTKNAINEAIGNKIPGSIFVFPNKDEKMKTSIFTVKS